MMISPVLLWNAQNQWVSFKYQTDHGAGGDWQLQHVLRFLLVQLVVFGPLLLWGLIGARRLAVRDQRWLVLFFFIFFVVLAYLSVFCTIFPYWIAPSWVALAPLAGLALAQAAQTRWRWVLIALAVLQGLLSLALPSLMFTGGVPFVEAKAPASSRASNPFADLHGWDQAGARVSQLARERNLTSVSVQNWTLASRLGWYARPLKVHVLEDRFDQFDIWAGNLPKGADTLLVDWSELAYVVPLGDHGFAGCQLLETLPIQRLGRPLSEFRFYACQAWSGAPQPRLLSEVHAP
jgi:hypothetical protein